MDPPTRVWIEDQYGEVVTAIRLIPNVTMDSLSCKSDGERVTFDIKEKLPKGLNLVPKSGLITGMATEELQPTQFTITATNSAGSATMVVTLTIAKCEYGNLLYPVFSFSAVGTLILSNNGKVFYNRTIESRNDKYNAICVPRIQYNYQFTCVSSTSFCYFHVEDSNGLIYMSAFAVTPNTKSGFMEITPTRKPIISIPSLISVNQNEQLYRSFSVEGIHGDLAIQPPLPSRVNLVSIVPFIIGNAVEPMIQKYTITASNTVGDTSVEFTFAVDQCPPGLVKLQVELHRVSVMDHWQVFDSQDSLLIDQLNDYRTDKQLVCWSPGSYRFYLSTTNDTPGWPDAVRLDVSDEHGVLAEYQLPSPLFEMSRHFTFEYPVPSQSEWKIHRGGVSKGWTRVKFNDKKWESGVDGSWGSFSRDVSSVFLRKTFALDVSKFTFLQMDVKQSQDCDVIVYVNEKQVLVLPGSSSRDSISRSTSNNFTRSTIPISSFSSPLAVAAEVRRATGASETTPIVFDIKVTALSSECIIQSVNGVASDNQSASSRPSYAFDLDRNTYWSLYDYPGVLRYTFASRSVVVNRATLVTLNDSPTSIRVEGVTADNTTVVLTSVQSNYLGRNDIIAMDFENSRAFPAYQFVFEKTETSSVFSVVDARFYSCSDRQCKKKRGYAAARGGVTRYGKCPLFTVGTRQMHCVEGDNTVEWVEDRSTCVKKIPSRQTAFVDWSFDLMGVTMKEWEATVKKSIVTILVSNMRVMEREIEFVLARDITDEELKLSVFGRITLEVEIGDYIAKHFKLFESQLNEELQKVMEKASIQTLSIDLREPIDVASIVQISVTVVIVLLVVACVYYIRLRMRSPKRKTLKRGEGETLLTESV